MDSFRYVICVGLIVGLIPAVAMWFLVHPFASRWRRLGAPATYVVLGSAMAASMLALALARDRLVGADLGTSYLTVALAAPCIAAALFIAVKRRRYLTLYILVGVPEVPAASEQRLLTEGPYAVIRNPRYVEFVLGVLGYALVANYVGAYVVWMLSVPAIYLIVILEERELSDRFGQEYLEYRRRVPRFVPRRRPPPVDESTRAS